MTPQSFKNKRAPKERGIAVIFVSVSLVALLLLMGFILDVSHLLHSQIILQRALDLGAVATTERIPDEGQDQFGITSPTNLNKLTSIALRGVKDNLEHMGLPYNPSLITLSYSPMPPARPERVRIEGSTAVDLFLLDRLSPYISTQLTGTVHASSVVLAKQLFLVLALDTSGSMCSDFDNDDTPVNYPSCPQFFTMIDTAKRLVDKLSADDNLSIIRFSVHHDDDSAEVVFPMQRLDLIKKNLARHRIETLPPRRHTASNIYDAIKKGRDQIASLNPTIYDYKAIVILSDGAATAPSDVIPPIDFVNVDAYIQSRMNDLSLPVCTEFEITKRYIAAILQADEARSEGIALHTVGFGTPHTAPHLTNPFQGNPESAYYMKEYMLARLANAKKYMVDHPLAASMPLPIPAQPDFPCVPSADSIKNEIAGTFRTSTTDSQLSDLAFAIGSGIKAQIIN